MSSVHLDDGWWSDLRAGIDDPGDTLPAWVISFAIHMAGLIIFGTIFLAPLPQPEALLITVVEQQPVLLQPDQLQQFRFSDQEHSDIGSIEVAGMELAASAAPEQSQLTELHTEPVTITEIAFLDAPMAFQNASAANLSENVQIKGAAGVGAVGTIGAVDRITKEILLSLEQRPTLVVWLFDRSGSMQSQRKQVRDRFDRIYQELGLSDLVGMQRDDGQEPLLTSIVSFGQEVAFVTEQPTADLTAIREAVDSIEDDPSGVEMVFTAVGMAAQRFQRLRTQSPQRNVMLIVASDEVGDDESQVDAVATLCRRNQMPVYVLGVPAPFGREEIDVLYVDPDPNFSQTPRWIPVRQGPETVAQEVVKLGFSGMTANREALLQLDSGFGPYCLTRLCVETGGIYFAIHPNRNEAGGPAQGRPAVMAARLNYFFDPMVMHAYRPDYVTLQEYHGLLAGNKARLAVVQAAQLAMVEPMSDPLLEFTRGTGDDAEARLKQALDLAQRDASILAPRINRIYETLKQGEKDRARLTDLRWRANFDLAMGRVLAVKVRNDAYNAMLALAKAGVNFKDPKNNTFVLVPADEIHVGSAMDRMAKQAREYLQRVVAEHPGTPWALLAEAELAQPIGWRWDEKFVEPPPRNMQQPNNNGNNRNPPRRPPNAQPPKPVRQDVKL